jgi:hypothetical protein
MVPRQISATIHQRSPLTFIIRLEQKFSVDIRRANDFSCFTAFGKSGVAMSGPAQEI